MLLAVDVTPARDGQSLVVGKLWLDAETAETVRFSFRYVGTSQWVAPEGETKKDSSSSRRANKLVSRLLTLDADLEYSLQEGRYWMPYRQVLSGRVSIPFAGDLVIPFEAVTTFRDYEINTGKQPVFSIPASRFRAVEGQPQGAAEGCGRTRSTRRGARATCPTASGRAITPRRGRVDATRSIARRPTRSRSYQDWGDSLTLAAEPRCRGPAARSGRRALADGAAPAIRPDR